MADRDDNRFDDDPDAPASAEEIAASERLRDALATGVGPDAALAVALRAAFQPAAIDALAHAALVLGERVSQETGELYPDEDETRRASDLRAALDERKGPDAAFAAMLGAAWAPADIDVALHDALVARAVRKLPRRSNVVRIAFGAAAAILALAASVLLALRPSGDLPLAQSRSTAALFDAPFQQGSASARIDKIALARAADYRDNRFAGWGVR